MSDDRGIRNLAWELTKEVLGQLEPEALRFGRDEIEKTAALPLDVIDLGEKKNLPNKLLRAASICRAIWRAISTTAESLRRGEQVVKEPEGIAELVKVSFGSHIKETGEETAVAVLEHLFRQCPSLIDLILGLALSPVIPACEPLGVMERGLLKVEASSGFVVSDQGHVLTAAHVVRKNAEVQTLFRYRTPYRDVKEKEAQAEIIHYDEKKDVCVLQIVRSDWQNLWELGVQPLPLSTTWTSGEWVLCLGYQEQEIFADPITVEAFIKRWDPVRAVRFRGEQVERDCLVLVIPHDYPAVAPGMSGGPVLALNRCQVIGMVTGANREAWVKQRWKGEEIWELVSSARYGFATPLSWVAESWPEFRECCLK